MTAISIFMGADAIGAAYEETPTCPIGLYAEIPGSSGLILIVR